MVNTSDIIIALCVSVAYLSILPFQLVLFPTNYYTVREIIYSKSLKKASLALASRFVFIGMICLLFWLCDKKDNVVIYGVTIGSFLCNWPSIYNYQLFLFWKNRSKFLYFLSCIFSIVFSYVCAKLIMEILLPIIFDGATNYFLDNSGFSFTVSIIELCMPLGIRKLLNIDEERNPYMDSDTFAADLCLTKRKILFDNPFEHHYFYEISAAAKKNDLSFELLATILHLERVNRGSWYHQLIEKLAVKWLKAFLIQKNATIGMAQIDIKTAKQYFNKAPERFLPEMIKPEVSIDLCAYKIRCIMEQFLSEGLENEYTDYIDAYRLNNLSENDKISLFISSQYVCGNNMSLRKFVLIYSTLISENEPSLYVNDSNG